MKKELQAALGLQDDDFGYHESDLYVVDTPEVRTWLKANYKFYSNCTRFKCQITGRGMLDIPFANSEFWARVERIANFNKKFA